MRKIDTAFLSKKWDDIDSDSTWTPVIPVLSWEKWWVTNAQEDVSQEPALLTCAHKSIDISHILSHTPNSNPSSFHWMDIVRPPTTVDSMIYDVIELYTSDDRLVWTIYTINWEDWGRYVIRSMCEYSTQWISRFMSFLWQATNPTTYNINSTCSTYRRLCQYLQSIYTEPVFSGKGRMHNSCPFG